MKSEMLDREKLINAIWENRGKLAITAQKLGVSVRTVYNYAGKYATVQNAIDAARQQFDEMLCDTSEVKLQQAVIDGKRWAVMYTLDTKGKTRGYVKRHELDGAVDIHVTYDEAD